MPDSIPCPQCGAQARITERFWLDSTDGPSRAPQALLPARALVHAAGRDHPASAGRLPGSRPGRPAELTGARARRCPRAAPELAS